MNRHPLRLCVVIALAALTSQTFGQASMMTLVTNGSTATRLNIVFFSEGYTSNELAQFPIDATAMLEHMLGVSPLNEYSNFFNAFAISVPSNESGSDHYTPTTTLVDTYFNSRYDSFGIQRLITIDGTGIARVNSLLSQFMPEYDVVAIVVNDPQYGGSGGDFLISSVNPSSPEIATHEFGHTFADLGDEYEYAGGTPGERPNTTSQTNLASIKWNAWIPVGTPIPTPDTSDYYDVVGLFQGAAYSLNYYRPKHNCKMRSLGVDFCEVCAEAIVKTIYTKATPIESNTPRTTITYKMTNGIPHTFTVTTISPSTHALTTQWNSNGIPLAGATSLVYTVTGFELPPGKTTFFRLDVRDPTPYVRSAPTNMMIKSVQWRGDRVNYSPPLYSTSQIPGEATLSWPLTASGLYLEQASTLGTPANWSPLLLISNQTEHTVSLENPENYFRLHHP